MRQFLLLDLGLESHPLLAKYVAVVLHSFQFLVKSLNPLLELSIEFLLVPDLVLKLKPDAASFPSLCLYLQLKSFALLLLQTQLLIKLGRPLLCLGYHLTQTLLLLSQILTVEFLRREFDLGFLEQMVFVGLSPPSLEDLLLQLCYFGCERLSLLLEVLLELLFFLAELLSLSY
jgi:hypothetical protein